MKGRVFSKFKNGVMDERLMKKIDDQISTISERFVKGDVNVQIIVEGYEAFYDQLAQSLVQRGKNDFHIAGINKKPSNLKPNGNITGILVDTALFDVLESDVIQTQYNEEEDSNNTKYFYLPFVHVVDKLTGRTSVFAGVHVSGCNSQYPKTGLKTLAQKLDEIHERTLRKSDIIAAGDFNTPPMNAKKTVTYKLLRAPYVTHVNPKSEAANYDQVIISSVNESEKKYEMMPKEALSSPSQALINSIEESRKKYLGDLQLSCK